VTWAVNFLYNGRRYNDTVESPTREGALSKAVMRSAVPDHGRRLTIHSNLRDRTWSAKIVTRTAAPLSQNMPDDLLNLPDPKTYGIDYADWPATFR